eukprot:Platyproteum_vivax@DN9226_c0_g1_i1.p1
MSGRFYGINAIKKLSDQELEMGVGINASWHEQYRDSCYIYVQGIDPKMTEGDIVIVFSQFGEVIDLNWVRNKEKKKTTFAFIGYENQRSTVLAVDNMNGANLLNRTLKVDHTLDYKAPKVFDEEQEDEEGNKKQLQYKATGAEGQGIGVFGVTEMQKKILKMQKEKAIKDKEKYKPHGALLEDKDETWAKQFEVDMNKPEKKKK